MAISNGQVEEVMRLIASGLTAKVRSLNHYLYMYMCTCTYTCYMVIIGWLLLMENLQLLHSPTCVHLRTQRRCLLMLQEVAGLKR